MIGERTITQVGARALAVSREIGGITILFGQILRALLPPRLDGRELIKNLHKMGNRSVPIVALTAFFAGGLMVVQSAPFVQRFEATSLAGWAAGYAVLREIGPILIALMFSGRVGANNTAELGTMVVTEQIDALRALAIDPISFLIVPRFIGIVSTLFLSTIFADALALFGAAYAGAGILGVEPMVFYNGLTSGLLGLGDVFHGLIKSVTFGIVIALASCQFGITTSGGAPGVGRAVNSTVVVSAAGIFVLDYIVSFAIG